MSDPIYFEEPPVARRLFASTTFAWLWLLLRLYLGWEWVVSGWGKDLRRADHLEGLELGDYVYRRRVLRYLRLDPLLHGERPGRPRRGAAVQASPAPPSRTAGPPSERRVPWYVDFLERVRDHGYKFLGPAVAITELVVGVLLIIGLFTGIAAFIGMVMNFSDVRWYGRCQPPVHHHLVVPDHGVASGGLVRPRSCRPAEVAPGSEAKRSGVEERAPADAAERTRLTPLSRRRAPEEDGPGATGRRGWNHPSTVPARGRQQ